MQQDEDTDPMLDAFSKEDGSAPSSQALSENIALHRVKEAHDANSSLEASSLPSSEFANDAVQNECELESSSEESVVVSAEPIALRPLSLLSVSPEKEQALTVNNTSIYDEDQAWVARAKVGDRQAFSKLFTKHHGRVLAMCTRLLRNPTEVEDAVQQTFLEAWKSLHRFEGRSKFTTWITRIAIHTCLGFRRKLKRLFFSEDTRPVEYVSEGKFSGHPLAADEQISYRRRRQSVAEALAHISEKKRVVFILAELEGMTAPEISEILKIPDATVRTRLFHARKEFALLVRAHPGFADLFSSEKLESEKLE